MRGSDQWSEEESGQLEKLVKEYGTKAWTTIAEHLGSRNSKQCRRRWKNFIAFPERKDSQWTEQEDKLLLQAYENLGNRWTDIATRLQGRTDNAVKNRWQLLQRRCGLDPTARKVQDICALVCTAAEHEQLPANQSLKLLIE